MGNFPARQLGGLPPERPRNIPSMEQAGEPFTAENCIGYTPADIRGLNTEFERRWNDGEWRDYWYVQAVKIFQDEVAGR